MCYDYKVASHMINSETADGICDVYRKSFDRFAVHIPRSCIFIGSTNHNDILSDKTGNRRFLPVQVNSIGSYLYDYSEELKADIEQCWAEAYQKYLKDEIPPYPDYALLDVIEEHQMDAMEDDPRIGLIESYLETHSIVCIKSIWEEARCMTRECQRKDSNEISAILDNYFTELEKLSNQRIGKYGSQKCWGKNGKSYDIKP